MIDLLALRVERREEGERGRRRGGRRTEEEEAARAEERAEFDLGESRVVLERPDTERLVCVETVEEGEGISHKTRCLETSTDFLKLWFTEVEIGGELKSIELVERAEGWIDCNCVGGCEGKESTRDNTTEVVNL